MERIFSVKNTLKFVLDKSDG